MSLIAGVIDYLNVHKPAPFISKISQTTTAKEKQNKIQNAIELYRIYIPYKVFI